MLERKSIIVALDLEATLISNAVSQFPRPGLYSFLESCHNNFFRIVIFTTVKEFQFRKIAKILAESQKVPDWFPDLEYVNWHGKYKDLSFIPNKKRDRVILIDDMEEYIKPEQKNSWFYIPGYHYPYPDDDSELKQIKDKLFQLN
jgi:hypothetical protein